jgi:transcriptional regulator with PAS, ATPase and Fis domain
MPDKPAPVPAGGLHDAVASLEKSMIHEAMQKYRGNKKKVAEELGISRAYLYKILAETQDPK